jgi:acetyl-CoA C-acetyltransferase
MREVVIVKASRTAIGKFGGTLKDIPVADLGAVVLKSLMEQTGIDPAEVNEVIMGQVLQAGTGQNTARQALLKSGIPIDVPAFTVNKVCGSGMKAIALAIQSIASGENEIVLAGGMESMSRTPFLSSQARWGGVLGNQTMVDCILSDGLTDSLDGCHMGFNTELLVKEFGISRSEQDEFSCRSQQKASQAIAKGYFENEIVGVQVPQKKTSPLIFATDEFVKPQTTLEVLSKLKPAFQDNGTVTAGNASGINDGAAALLLMSAEQGKHRGIRPMASIISYASAGVEPKKMGLGPVPATQKALDKAGIQLAEIDLIELNEAFAAQTLAVMQSLNFNRDRVNVHGGSIALGHPIGASGARIVVTLLHAMQQKEARLGLATLCIGGGQGMSLLLKSDN